MSGKDSRQALRDVRGFLLANGMATPEPLVVVGAALREAAVAAEILEAPLTARMH
jgi:hypothetical protein